MLSLIVIQTAVLVVFAISCFGSVFSVHLTANDLLEGEGVIEYSENGDGIGVYGEYNAGAYYEILYTDYYTLHPGAYDITLDYSVTRDETLLEASQPVALGTVELRSDQLDDILWDNDIYLLHWRESQTQRFWVTFPNQAEYVEFAVKYHATGDLFITGVTIQELPIWRFSRLLSWLVIFLLLDGMIWFFFIRNKRKKTDRLIVIAGILCVGFSSLLAVNPKIIFGDDIYYHLGRFIFMSDSLFAGQIPVRIHMSAINGFGYVSSLFYGEVFLTLPAVLYRMAFPVQACYQVYMVAVNALTYWIAYACFKHIGKNPRIASVGACLYTLAAYRLACLYERSAVGEYTAMAFLPLIVYGMWKLYTASDDTRFSVPHYSPLVLGLCGAMQSHLLTTMMSVVMILLFCIIFLRKTLKPRRLWALCKVAGWTLLINLWFLWPLVDSLSMDLRIDAYDALGTIAGRTVDPVYLLGGLSQGYTSMDERLMNAFTLGLPLSCGLAVYILFICRRKHWQLTRDPSYRQSRYAFLFAVTALWLCSPYFPWGFIASLDGELARYFCSVQFPWRYLAYASVFSATTIVLLMVALASKNRKKWVRIIAVTLLALAVVISGSMMAQLPARRTYGVYYSDLPQNAYNVSFGEYHLKGTYTGEFMSDVNRPASEAAVITDYEIKNEDYYVTISNPGGEATVEFPRFHYDNYHAYDCETGEELTLQSSEDISVEALIPAGYEGTVVLRYEPPVSWRIAEIISLLSLIFYFTLYVKSKRQNVLPFRNEAGNA